MGRRILRILLADRRIARYGDGQMTEKHHTSCDSRIYRAFVLRVVHAFIIPTFPRSRLYRER